MASAKRELSIVQFPPNYIYRDTLPMTPVVMDVVNAGEAEFAEWMIHNCQARAYANDPTKKHSDALGAKEQLFDGRLSYLPVAVPSSDDILTFFESLDNESGSILNERTNALRGRTRSYDVRALSVHSLLAGAQETNIHLLKLDWERAEYEFIANLDREVTQHLHQVFVEFHHHCSPYTTRDTHERVLHMNSIGFEPFTTDDHNYLFFRTDEN